MTRRSALRFAALLPLAALVAACKKNEEPTEPNPNIRTEGY